MQIEVIRLAEGAVREVKELTIVGAKMHTYWGGVLGSRAGRGKEMGYRKAIDRLRRFNSLGSLYRGEDLTSLSSGPGKRCSRVLNPVPFFLA